MIDQPAAHYMVAGDLKAQIGHLHDFIPHDKVDFIFGENDNPFYPSDVFVPLIVMLCYVWKYTCIHVLRYFAFLFVKDVQIFDIIMCFKIEQFSVI